MYFLKDARIAEDNKKRCGILGERMVIRMTLRLMYRKCPMCKKRYPWNPDLGQLLCPRCGPLSYPGMGDVPGMPGTKTIPLDILFKKEKK